MSERPCSTRLREELRKRNYLPILFDFEKPRSRDTDETITLLARMARFVIADISDAKAVLQELRAIVPDLPSVPVQPIILAMQEEPGMFDFYRNRPSFLTVHRYADQEQLLADLGEKVIRPAELKVWSFEVEAQAISIALSNPECCTLAARTALIDLRRSVGIAAGWLTSRANRDTWILLHLDGGIMTGKTITRDDLFYAAVYEKMNLSRSRSSAVLVEAVLKEITDTLAKGETVKLSSFGSFIVRKKSQRMGRNRKTGIEVPISPRRVVVFKPSPILKKEINEDGPVPGRQSRSRVLQYRPAETLFSRCPLLRL